MRFACTAQAKGAGGASRGTTFRAVQRPECRTPHVVFRTPRAPLPATWISRGLIVGVAAKAPVPRSEASRDDRCRDMVGGHQTGRPGRGGARSPLCAVTRGCSPAVRTEVEPTSSAHAERDAARGGGERDPVATGCPASRALRRAPVRHVTRAFHLARQWFGVYLRATDRAFREQSLGLARICLQRAAR